ncbi:MAG TPA: glycosyltransferase family A protein [Candidatus Binataceae bacterium]|nr:glycosyltransferase family A protein [Candidatus Binataceae bacterium]
MNSKYVLVTAAYNEAGFIEHTIASVAAQSILPLRWIIVSDGSTDETDDIVRAAMAKHRFIEHLRIERPVQRALTIDRVGRGIAFAVAAGMEKLGPFDYEYLGKLDADVTLEPKFFEKVIGLMDRDPQLGLAGGGIHNVGTPGGFLKPEFVGGPVRVFRKECWKQIGGLLPAGNEDGTSAASARMHGWKVRCFPEVKAYQHGVPRNTVREKIPVCFRMGQADYIMGTLFWFEFLRSGVRMFKPPVVLAGIAMFLGYLWSWARRMKTELPAELVEFMRAEQRQKLRRWLWRVENSSLHG